MAKAVRLGTNLTEVVSAALRAYAAAPDPTPPETAIAPHGGKWHRSRGDGTTACGRWTRDMHERAPITRIADSERCRRCWP
jgi:hypothetical protein